VAATLTGLIVAWRRQPIPLTRRALTFALVVAVLGTLLPNVAFYLAVERLPAGVMSVVISAVPILALPLAVALGRDRLDGPRVVGVVLGLAGVAVIAAPGAALPDPSLAPWLLVALLGPLLYAVEANFVASTGTAGLDPAQAIFLASLMSVLLSGALALGTGQVIDPREPWGSPEWALTSMAAISALTYVAYVWLAREGGAVFASQLSYVVTVSGVLWAAVLLGERPGPGLWLALALLLGGLALVRPGGA
jgi:drug/metabolite transporter (DMT)-like permease